MRSTYVQNVMVMDPKVNEGRGNGCGLQLVLRSWLSRERSKSDCTSLWKRGVNETRGCERDSPKLDAACVSGEGRNTKPNPLVGVAGDSSSEPVCESR